MDTPIEFWFEFASSYSYPAAMRVEELVQRRGHRLVWRPFLLGPIFAKQGWNDSPFNLYPAKGQYMWRDLHRLCASLQIPFRRPSQFPRNGLWAARITARFSDEPWVPEFVRTVYQANFAHDLDIAAEAVLRDCLHGVVPDADATLSAARDEESKAVLRRQTEHAVEIGVFGAPSFVVGQELFWGNERLEAALTFADEVRSRS